MHCHAWSSKVRKKEMKGLDGHVYQLQFTNPTHCNTLQHTATHNKQTTGLDGHVCELQLILKAFYERRSNDGHARFVAFRNKHAE